MAIPKRKQQSRNYCMPCCSGICTVFAIFLMAFGGYFPGALDKKVQDALYQKTIVAPTEVNYANWTKDNRDPNGIGIIFTYFFFNITNPYAVMNGAQPKVEKLGPYVFQKFTIEGQVQYYDNFKWRASRKQAEMVFRADRSDGKLTDKIFYTNAYAGLFQKLACRGVKPFANGGFKFKTFCGLGGLKGMFTETDVQGLIYGHKLFGVLPFRINNGHCVCDRHGTVPVCKEAWLQKQYDVASNGQFSCNWESKKMEEQHKQTGYGNEGCKRPLEYSSHETDCPQYKGGNRGRDKWGMNKPDSAPKVVTDNLVYNDLDQTTRDKMFRNVFMWYDNTPYDKSDDLKIDTTFEQTEDHPCTWTGKTNNKAGCPYMDEWKGYGPLLPVWHHGRMNKEPLKMFDGLSWRTMTNEFVREELNYGVKTYRYEIPDKYWLGGKENAKYGMHSSGDFARFPGDFSWPMERTLKNIPVVWTYAHWAKGGDKAKKWNQDMGLRPGNEYDVYFNNYEPITGFPMDSNVQLQLNFMIYPSALKLKVVNATTGKMTSATAMDYENLSINGKSVNMARIGAFRKCKTTEFGATSQGGCPVMVPHYLVRLKFELSNQVASKVRNIVIVMGKVKGFKSLLYTFCAVGVIIQMAVFAACAWFYGLCGEEEDTKIKLVNAA